MIKIDPNKTKKLSMEVMIEGIDPSNLDFTFRIKLDEDIEVGIPCLLNGNNVEVTIPKLSSYLKEIKTGSYNAKLEVTASNFYIKPFEDVVYLESEPKVMVKPVVETIDNVVKESVKVGYVKEEIKEEIKKEEIPIIKEEKKKEVIKEEPHKKSKFGKLLEK